MESEIQYLREIAADPSNDLPRLMYADWLESHDPLRAELIRDQCVAATWPRWDARRFKLEKKWDRRLPGVQSRWMQGVRWAQAVGFRRGCIEHVQADGERILQHADQIQSVLPVSSVQVTRADGMEQLAKHPLFAQLRTLHFSGVSPDKYDFGQLLRSPHWAVENLEFSGASISLQVLDAFSGHPPRLGPRRLDLRHTELPAPAIGELLALPIFDRLATLKLGPIPHGDDRYPLALELSPTLNRLRQLELEMCHLDASKLRGLLQYCSTDSVRWLSLPRNPLSWQGIRCLREAPFIRSLVGLDLSSCGVNSRGFSQLAELDLPKLRVLNMGDNLLNPRCGQVLAESKLMRRVLRLFLRGTRSKLRQGNFPLGDDGLERLCRCDLQHLQSLDVSQNRIGAAGLESLVASTRDLVELDLSHNRLPATAAEILVKHAHWPDLQRLRLEHNDLDDDDKKRLRQHFGDVVSY